MENNRIMGEKEGIMAASLLLIATGAAVIETNLVAGTICIGGAVALIFLRGYLKTNGRWNYK